MDYAPLVENYTGKIQAKIMEKSDIEDSIEAYQLYGADHYPEGHIDKLNHALADIKDVSELMLRIKEM